MYSYNKRLGFQYKLNYGVVDSASQQKNVTRCAYIMGIHHPVRNFDGRVIAIVRRFGGRGVVWVVAPKSTRFIVNDVKKAISFAEGTEGYSVECFYETSCGAIVFRKENNAKHFLLIRNRRSTHWGFPKGHVEPGETNEETAVREVMEETGIPIEILPSFAKRSEYTIQGKIEKSVVIFLAQTNQTHYTMQEEEIEECGWFSYENAMKTLNYENDKRILAQARQFMLDHHI